MKAKQNANLEDSGKHRDPRNRILEAEKGEEWTLVSRGSFINNLQPLAVF